MDWRHRAICRDEDPELFFPVGTEGPALLQTAEAKTVCRRCPVVSECLAWALDSGQDDGVWGGMSEHERRALKRRNARARPVQVVDVPESTTGIPARANPTPAQRRALVVAHHNGGRVPGSVSGSVTSAMLADGLAERQLVGTDVPLRQRHTLLTRGGAEIAARLVEQMTEGLTDAGVLARDDDREDAMA